MCYYCFDVCGRYVPQGFEVSGWAPEVKGLAIDRIWYFINHKRNGNASAERL